METWHNLSQDDGADAGACGWVAGVASGCRPAPHELAAPAALAPGRGRRPADRGAGGRLPSAARRRGGAQFKAPCGDGQNLAGFDLRAGADIDAVRPVCVYGSGLTNQGPGGARYVFRTDWFGSPGARTDQLLCPLSTPIVLAMHIVSEGIHTITVNNIALYCGQADGKQTVSAYP